METAIWISTKDKLPVMVKEYEWEEQKSNPVLVFDVFNIIRVAYCSIEDENELEWHTCCSECWNITGQVTHWMPLPQAPT